MMCHLQCSFHTLTSVISPDINGDLFMLQHTINLVISITNYNLYTQIIQCMYMECDIR